MFFIITFTDNDTKEIMENPREIMEYETEEETLDALDKWQLTPVENISQATDEHSCIVIEGEKKIFGLRDA